MITILKLKTVIQEASVCKKKTSGKKKEKKCTDVEVSR